ncbi:TKL family protein kinase [Tritrichomonas foetus]|uniref:TKL family protein kinase n=1 Tax=Tritrichomonas foetus TaxID=1144522 RepID=A0A1J4J884_9EUKA|nr:TKL family protein kinase [Tritrichomonas foetus]|eukprot:OHS93899.1 TKL family protein kinase [Tritrichomonas foetus]
MNELSPQNIVAMITAKENDIRAHTKQAYIFRSSVAYISQMLQVFVRSIRNGSSKIQTDTQIQALRQIYEILLHYDSILPHLSEDKWIQPALNWPASYVHKYIEGLRENLINLIPPLGLVSTDVLKYDSQQDHVNQIADLKALKNSVQSLSSQISINDAVGVQRQIETKLNEITKLLPRQSQRRATFNRRPSAENLPIIQMRKRIEELLGQFKSINIELEDLRLDGQIGAGGFGTVFKATRLSTSEIVAVKELRSNRLTMSSWASLYAEVETMASVRHPFVLELVGAHITDPYRIITRFCPGKSLFDRLHRPSSQFQMLSPTRLTCIAYQVSVGMAHLHSMSFVHRDLKTLNILLDDEDDGCVADFGLSGMMKDNQELCGGVGTPHYTAPEVLAHARYGPKVDIFSYAIVLWEMLMRQVPYGDMSHMAIYEHVVTRGWRLPIPQDTPEGLKKLITRCWSKNPNDRPEFNEIVSLFEKGDIYFPKSEPINFQAIKSICRCPPLNLEYLTTTLKNTSDPHFSSLVYYVCAKGDEKLKRKLRDENILEIIRESKENIDAILSLASFILESSEFSDFLKNGGLEMFQLCVETNSSQSISAALRLGLKVPKSELVQLEQFLPHVVQILQGNTGASSHILQFLTRFDVELLTEFTSQISDALLDVVSKVEDQQTFDAIVILLPLVKDSLTLNQMRMFYRLLTCDLVVPSEFVSILIESPDNWSHASLILSILKATAKSDITDVFLQFLQRCVQNEKEVFLQLYKMQDFFGTLQEILDSGAVQAPLFLLYCIAPIVDAAMKLANHPLMTSLVNMKGFQVQRLQIFTSLCMHEAFCTQTQHIDGIIHILVSSVSAKSLVGPSIRLIGAFSSHPGGCKLLGENGVLELFTQLFLSSSCGDSELSHIILRNIARNCHTHNSIPQGALIISCLMQDMLYDTNRKCEILDTIVALVKTMPGSVQEHDLLKIIMPQLLQCKPLLVKLALKLFSIVEPAIMRNIYPQLLSQIYKILNSRQLMYPEIIEECLKVVQTIEENFDISEFIQKTQLIRYINDIISLLPNEDPHIVVFDNYLKKLDGSYIIHV